MAAKRDEHSLETLVKTNQAIIRIDIALLRMSPVVRIVHLKGHIFDGFFTCHCSLSLLPTVRSRERATGVGLNVYCVCSWIFAGSILELCYSARTSAPWPTRRGGRAASARRRRRTCTPR